MNNYSINPQDYAEEIEQASLGELIDMLGMIAAKIAERNSQEITDFLVALHNLVVDELRLREISDAVYSDC